MICNNPTLERASFREGRIAVNIVTNKRKKEEGKKSRKKVGAGGRKKEREKEGGGRRGRGGANKLSRGKNCNQIDVTEDKKRKN